MADNMKAMSSRKVVQIEEHAVQFDKRDLAEMIESEDPTNTVDPRDLTIFVSATTAGSSEPKGYGASQLLEMARSKNSDIPEDAEVVISVRWRKETDAPQMPVPQYAPQYAPAPAGYVPNHSQQGGAIAPQDARQCATCGALPAVQGPTPDCHDVNGCGAVRQLRGELPIPKAVDAPNAPQVGVGLGAPSKGTKLLINRETGEKAFADRDGRPYGKHDDYQK